MLEEECAQIRREALAQPEIVPVPLRDGVSEPLMRDLVRHEAFQRAYAVDLLLIEEDRAGVLHPAEACRRLDQSQLVVGIRTDEIGVVRENLRNAPHLDRTAL